VRAESMGGSSQPLVEWPPRLANNQLQGALYSPLHEDLQGMVGKCGLHGEAGGLMRSSGVGGQRR
jgi:hypothetical protein